MSEEMEQWTCAACTLANDLTTEACDACGATSPLVLASYEAEDHAAASANASSLTGASKSGRGRGVSQESMLSDAMSGDVAAELDPWTQAEFEWANVEALQETTSPKKRK